MSAVWCRVLILCMAEIFEIGSSFIKFPEFAVTVYMNLLV